MNIKLKEFRFLIFFIPIYFCKLLNITPSEKWFVLLSIVCFLFIVAGFVKEKMERKSMMVLLCLVAYTGLLVITCGKQGPFFSAIIILSLYKLEDKRKIYKWSFWGGVLAVLVSCYIERDGVEVLRYINGEWRGIFKRSNILYISFMAVVSTYLFLEKKQSIKIKKLIILAIIGYGMFKYTGSRTGLVVLLLLLVTLFAFRYKAVQKNIVVKKLCVFSPLLMLITSIALVWGYEKNAFFIIIDSMLQGRIRLGFNYFTRYDISIIGQKLFQSSTATDFWNLDCAYYYMLLGYGLIFTIVWIIFSCKLISYLYNQKRFIDVAVMVMYAVYGISETFLPNGFLNVSIFLYAEYLYYLLNWRKEGAFINEKNKNNCYVSSSVS